MGSTVLAGMLNIGALPGRLHCHESQASRGVCAATGRRQSRTAGRCLHTTGRTWKLAAASGHDAPSQQPSDAMEVVPVNPQSPAFGDLEHLLAQNANEQPGTRSDWQEVEGAWVLRPASGQPRAVVHFIGGAFVGAAPQLTYRLFLESLAGRSVLVVATPYPTGFDHLRIADETQFKFDRCMRVLGDAAQSLPVYGVGHSLGALVHLLISSRYASLRAGNVLMSYNSVSDLDRIPFVSELLGPSARALGPILTQLAASPLRSSVESAQELLRGMSPSLVKQLLPVLDQLSPIYLDVAQGRQQFQPSREESRELVRTYYGVPRNMLIKFAEDPIDETVELAALLQTSAAVSASLDLRVCTLSGDHQRPLMQQAELPPEVAQVANQAMSQGNEFLGRLSAMATQAGFAEASTQLEDFVTGMSGLATALNGSLSGPAVESMQQLADEVATWMGVADSWQQGPASLPNARRALPGAQLHM